MGGKGSKSSAPAPMQQQQDDNMGMYQAMLMTMMMNQANQQPPPMIQMPEVQKTQRIDYTEKQDQLSQKAKADYMAEQNKRKRFVDMTHTSYLLDDEEPTTTQTVLK